MVLGDKGEFDRIPHHCLHIGRIIGECVILADGDLGKPTSAEVMFNLQLKYLMNRPICAQALS